MGHVEGTPQRLTVEVVYSPAAGVIDVVSLSLVAGSTVADALRESALQARHPGLDLAVARVGVWGALCSRDDALRDRDRVEVYRPLCVDPKEARRRRQRAQVKSKRSNAASPAR